MDKIINITLIAIILMCGWAGYRKGIIMGFGGVLVVIISLFGANILSNTFSYEIVPVLRPFVSGYMEAQVKKSVYEKLGIDPEEGSDYSVNDLLAQNPSIVHEVLDDSVRAVGIWGNAASSITDEAEMYVWYSGATCHEALTEVLCAKVSYAAGVMLAFLLISITLTVVGNIPNFSFKLPYFELVDDIAGAVLGSISGIMYCFVIVWALKFMGMFISEASVRASGIASVLLRIDLVYRFTGL